ncbi:4161_t:CDS:1, partial [Gigaspora rosea]
NKLTKSELHKIVKIATSNDYILDKNEIGKNNDNLYKESSNTLSQNYIILEDIVNLQNPVFQDREIVQFEFSTNIADTTNSIEDNIDMNFNSKNLVDTVLSAELEIK